MWATVTAIAGAIKEFFGFANKVAAEVHDHKVDVAGQNKIVAADLKEANDVNAKVLKAAVDTDAAAVDYSLQHGKF